MKVSELHLFLGEFLSSVGDMDVLIDGHGCGLDDVEFSKVRQVLYTRDINTQIERWRGRHEESNEANRTGREISGLVLSRWEDV